jgi:hypothetical protein
MTTAADGTVWVAGRQDRETQLISVAPDGLAHRTRFPDSAPTLTSLAVRADGTLFAATGSKAIWRVNGDRLAVAYGKRDTGDPGLDLALYPPFVADGKPMTSGNLGWVKTVGIDSTGQILFTEAIDEVCYRVRRIDTVGNVSTVAGRACPDAPQLSDGRFPAARTPAKELPLSARTAAFTVGPSNSLCIVTGPSLLQVDSAGQASVILGSSDESASQVPDPAGERPLDQWKPALSTRFQAATPDDTTNVAVSPEGVLATIGELDGSDVPDSFSWQATAGDTTVRIDAPKQARSGIALLRNGNATTASLIGTKIAFRGTDLLVAASRDEGAVIVRIPLPA